MLTITNIKKVYRTGSLTQRALDGVSLSLRDNEFVAILGQSGSGKTTLLNIIGGLDRYDEGDLIINGISTKKYSDRDWDSYRNHTVGFVFQSYNLIPHQTILKNVELALTISGIPSKERTARAQEALEKVGLIEHIHKKPSQLSGGQMQRVAIARALVNDPDILLADEPTGALDSDTSIQVMDLLKEVARDRLVVMVTHNPELAEQYATRIVTLKDGRITSDSDPYVPEQGETVHKNLGKASMSFVTSLLLSFNNLWTKKTRTILVAFAGSIGIIGIAMILAMSTGANDYIRSVEEESLQSYPLTISDTNFSLMSMYSEMGTNAQQTENDKDVQEWSVVTNLFSGVTKNDLKSLKAYFESGDCDIKDYVQALEYGYNLTPQIYKLNDAGDGYRQVNPDQAIASLGFSGSESNLNGMLSSVSSSTDSFFALPREAALYRSNYDLKAGSWPQSYDECVITLSSSGRISDMALYIMGLKDPDTLDRIMQAFSDGEGIDVNNVPGSYYYDELIGCEFRLLSASSYYSYDEEYKVWSNRSADKKYMMDLLRDADTLRVVGVIQPKEGVASTSMNVGFAYTAELIDHIINISADSDIVKAQLAQPEINVFTGKPFDEENTGEDMSLDSLFKIDTDALQKALSLDPGALDLGSFDLSGLDLSDLDLSDALGGMDLSALLPDLSQADLTALLGSIRFNVTEEDLGRLFSDLMQGYLDYSAGDPRTDISSLPSSLIEYLSTDGAQELIRQKLEDIIAEKSVNIITPEYLAVIVEEVSAGYPDYLSDMGLSDDGEYTYLSEYLNSPDGQSRITAAAAKIRDQLRAMLINADDVAALTQAIIGDYDTYAQDHELPSVSYLLQSFSDYLNSDTAKKLILAAVSDFVDTSGLEAMMQQYSDEMSAQLGSVMQSVMGTVGERISDMIGSSMGDLMSGMSDSLMNAFDPEALSQVFGMNMSASELKDLMVSLFSNTRRSLESNLKLLGYADVDSPSTITIYPKDFDSKNRVKDIINDYNARMEASGEKDKVIQYTDIVDALMNTVTVIIDVISYVLIAFVAISLVVSSIMIGVITYISVLERRKEIGILRAIGASKRNISQVFNAETFIIGALAGVFGIVITELLIIPSNILIHHLSDVENINAVLPPLSAVILILLSIVLTLIGGLIPSRKAAKSDPVTALRSE